MRTVHVAGNPLVPEDSLPLRLLPRLKKAFPAIDFQELAPSEELPRELTLIDTVQGASGVRVLTELERIVSAKPVGLHDFDLGLTLKLLKKAGRLDSVIIICVPMTMTEEAAFAGVCAALQSLARRVSASAP